MYNRIRYSDTKWFLPLLLLLFVPTIATGQITEKASANVLESYYINLNLFIKNVKQEGDFSVPQKSIEALFDNCRSITISKDYQFAENNNETLSNKISLNSYLINLRKTLSEHEISYGFKKRDVFGYKKIGSNTSDTVQISCKVKINKVMCIAKFRFKNDKITSITVEPCPLELFAPNLNFALGYKFNKCLNFSVGIDGLSDRWFLNHLRFELEFNFLYNQEHPHYSTATDGTPSQLTYISENGDFGIGMNIGYRIIPDKYGDLNWGPTWLSASIGFGGVFYDKWWEYNGTSEGESHGRSAALYIKPSLCLEYLITDHFGMGIEAGYYFCPKYDPMQGLGLKVVTKFAL